ncbi:phage portal protein [Amycolatopsis sp. cmx-11-32]|uniref:phage portal protein n=1 Tax=Amycolatopsis sp. cmx-11-32 TaxID=2785796 RepID=UPI0039E695C2
MSLFSRASTVDDSEIPTRPVSGRTGTAVVTNKSAMQHSAVWACLRLRADLISTMPVDSFRMVDGIQVETKKPPVLIAPGGERVKLHEWMYSTQVDLDRAGNAFGIITAFDGLGLPARIELVDLADVTVRIRGGQIDHYRIRGVKYLPHQIWHEKQFTVAGLPVGLSPTSYAAMSIGQYLSAQQFALDWFTDGAIPAGELRNTEKTVSPVEATAIKQRFKASVAGRDLFVHGKDWEYKPIQAMASDANFLQVQQFGIVDIARFFGCPADVIDGAVATGSITYASISQRNLQLLIMNIGPAVFRRESALSDLLPRPRFVKLNSDALLRMDPQTRAEVLGKQIATRQLAPSEARALENRMPFTDEQLAEFDRLFGNPRTQPTTAESGATT